jgi:hypothetical protein
MYLNFDSLRLPEDLPIAEMHRGRVTNFQILPDQLSEKDAEHRTNEQNGF